MRIIKYFFDSESTGIQETEWWHITYITGHYNLLLGLGRISAHTTYVVYVIFINE